MLIRRSVLALALSFSLAGPTSAAESFLPFDPNRPLDGVVRPDDVAVLFDYLREAYSATLEGREPPRSDALQRRADAIGEELKLRGNVAGILLLNALERSVKELLREPSPRQTLPPYPPAGRL